MMVAVRQTGLDAHASDGELVRLLDGECDLDERARVEAHARACPVCSARLEVHRRRSARLSLLLARSDPAGLERRAAALTPPSAAPARLRPRPAWPRYLRAAAVLAGLLALGWVVQPVRAWIVARWTALTRPTPMAVAPAPRRAAPAAPAAATSVAFVPDAADFIVAFETRPAGGRLSLRVGPGARVTLTSPAQTDVLVLPGELRIRNAASSTADYRVEIPSGITRLRVRVGERTVLDIPPAPHSPGWTIDLGRGVPTP